MTRALNTFVNVLTIAVGLLLAAGITAGQVDRSDLDDLIRAEMERQRVPGVAVAVLKNGRVVKSNGYGLANLEHAVPVKPETVFQSGSLGKQFTAAAVMTLVQDGKLALTDSIKTYLPEAPDTWRSITVRHLLTHTAGIPNYTGETFDLTRDYSEEELARMAFGSTLEFPAGSRWNYSNTGYVLLGLVIRRASGRFYGDILRDSVFRPLGMKTARIISEEDIVPNRAAGYRLVSGEVKNQAWVAPSLNTTADGSLYLSLLDLIAWEQAVRTGSVLTSDSWAAVFEPARLDSGRTYPYGFGWEIATIGDQTVYRHGGSWQGFRSYLARYRQEDLTVIVLANLAQAQPQRLADAIAATFNAALAPTELTAIPDTEPQIARRVRNLLEAAAEGRLSTEHFAYAYISARFFPAVAARYAELLKGLGRPARMELLERTELGDDRIYVYDVAYPDATLRVRLGFAPDDRITTFQITRR